MHKVWDEKISKMKGGRIDFVLGENFFPLSPSCDEGGRRAVG
jgi:hypothetical protein